MKSNIAGITHYNNGELVIDATGLTFSFANSTKYNIPAGVTVKGAHFLSTNNRISHAIFTTQGNGEKVVFENYKFEYTPNFYLLPIGSDGTCEKMEFNNCEFAETSWPYVRVQAGISNGAYSNPRYGHPTDANGNVVEDDNHVHNDGEDHHILCVFDQLYGGGQGVYGNPTHTGVTVIYNNK